MAEERVRRRLAAILAADVAGYSRLMEADEEGTLAALTAHRSELIEPCIAEHRGRVVKTTGDGLLAEFASVVDAVRCAAALQQAMGERNTDIREDRRIAFRIGVNLGDVIVQEGDVFGEGVNVAARLEGLAKPGGICISGAVHEQVRHKLHLAYQDMGEQAVKNIAGPVRVWRIGAKASEAAPREAQPAQALFARPAVAVLPFENLSGDPDQEYFADGLTEDIITALSLWRSFPVIARNSTFAYKGHSPDIRAVGRELGARYVVEGSVRRAGPRVRVTAQLINCEAGHHVWAERYDRDMADIFDLQDELAERIAATLSPELERAEYRQSASSQSAHLDAWDCYQRGMYLLSAMTKERNAQAREMFRKAIEFDGTYSRAYTELAHSYHRDLFFGYAESREESLGEFFAAGRKAIELDDSDSTAHQVLGLAYLWSKNYPLALAEAEKALELNPSNAAARIQLGVGLNLDGRPGEAIPQLERALRLNPKHPRIQIYLGHMADAYLNAGQYENAVECARKAIASRSDYLEAHVILASALGHLGRGPEAEAALGECVRIDPDFMRLSAGWRNYRISAREDHVIEGLRKAGWEG